MVSSLLALVHGYLFTHACGSLPFSRVCGSLPVFPRLSQIICLPALVAGYLFPALVAYFPTLVADGMFSRACYRLHVFSTVVDQGTFLFPKKSNNYNEHRYTDVKETPSGKITIPSYLQSFFSLSGVETVDIAVEDRYGNNADVSMAVNVAILPSGAVPEGTVLPALENNPVQITLNHGTARLPRLTLCSRVGNYIGEYLLVFSAAGVESHTVKFAFSTGKSSSSLIVCL